MPLTREERKLLHQKSKQPTFGSNKPDDREGYEGDVSYRKVEGSGTVQYVKTNGTWNAISSSGTMPSVRMGGGGGSPVTISTGSGGATSHSALDNLDLDDHTQYLLIDGSRAMTNTMLIGSDSDGTDRSIVWGHSTLKTIMGIDDSSDAFVINTDDAFDSTLANNSFSIDANHNVIIAGDVSVGDDLFLTSSGSVINWNSGDVTLTHSSGKLTFGGDGTVELDFNNHEMTNVDIDSGAIDGTTIGAASASSGAFTTITASTSVDITGSTGLILENDETITNAVNGTILLTAATTSLSGDLTVTGNNINFGNSSGIDNTTSGRVSVTDVGLGLHINTPVAFTSAAGMAHGTESSTFDSFALRWKSHTSGSYKGQHIAGGELDYKNNYCMVGHSSETSKYADHATNFALQS